MGGPGANGLSTNKVLIQCRPELREQRRHNTDAARTHRCVSPQAYMSQRNTSGGKDLTFVMRYNSFTSCGIVMINKTNSQV